MSTVEEFPPDQIKIGDRTRKELGNVNTLAKSIAEIGLLHPVVITLDNFLIAGERRIAAVKLLNWKTIPVRRMPFKRGEVKQ